MIIFKYALIAPQLNYLILFKGGSSEVLIDNWDWNQMLDNSQILLTNSDHLASIIHCNWKVTNCTIVSPGLSGLHSFQLRFVLSSLFYLMLACWVIKLALLSWLLLLLLSTVVIRLQTWSMINSLRLSAVNIIPTLGYFLADMVCKLMYWVETFINRMISMINMNTVNKIIQN